MPCLVCFPQEIANYHHLGGQITISSEGKVFWVWFPFDRVVAQALPGQTEPPPPDLLAPTAFCLVSWGETPSSSFGLLWACLDANAGSLPLCPESRSWWHSLSPAGIPEETQPVPSFLHPWFSPHKLRSHLKIQHSSLRPAPNLPASQSGVQKQRVFFGV